MRHLKRLTNAALGRLQVSRMYGGLSMSVPSYIESTDSLIHCKNICVTVIKKMCHIDASQVTYLCL